MSTRTPLEVIEAYNYELWNKQNYELGAEIIADHVTRHYPDTTVEMTRVEALQRVKDAWEQVFTEIEFTIHKLLVDGEYVTLLWEMQAKDLQSEDFIHSSIEVFRVADGQIFEFWNPINANETNGLWG